MSTKLICPDCGGVVGEAGPGETACTCFVGEPDGKSDTDAIGSEITDKLCIVCGKDVTGHRRVKDSRGYMCYACAKEERRAEKEGKIACKECRKLIKPAGLVAYQGKMICQSCFHSHQEEDRFKRKVSTKGYDAVEKQRLKVLAIIFGVLLLIVLYSLIRR